MSYEHFVANKVHFTRRVVNACCGKPHALRKMKGEIRARTLTPRTPTAAGGKLCASPRGVSRGLFIWERAIFVTKHTRERKIAQSSRIMRGFYNV